MQRKLYNTLKQWQLQSQGKTAIVIEGARRVGKSYVANQFSKNEYKTRIVIDFNHVSPQVINIFENYLYDLDAFFKYLSAFYATPLIERRSILVFDEVQMYPKARAAVKYIVEDGRYDVLETGSLISLKKNVQDIVIPSEERHISMYPMDFEEFLWALGENLMWDVIKENFAKKRPMGQAMHRKAMDLMRLYTLVGGMPQAIEEYVKSKDFSKVESVKRDILSLYEADIQKYAPSYALKVRSVFNDIPSQLQKHDKKFRLSDLQEGARYRDYENSFLWLDDARLINICYNSTEPTIGLKLRRDRLSLKCYTGDTGLLLSQAFDENGKMAPDVYKKILLDKLELNNGMIVENLVAQMLRAAGHKLYFYSKASANAAERMEIDFLISKPQATARHNISPIEVKSGNSYTLSSLRKCIDKFGKAIATPYVIHTADYKEAGGITYLPLYMVPLL